MGSQGFRDIVALIVWLRRPMQVVEDLVARTDVSDADQLLVAY